MPHRVGTFLLPLAVALLSACGVREPTSPPRVGEAQAYDSRHAARGESPASTPTTGGPSVVDAATTGSPELVRLVVLDGNERAPKPLPDDRSFARGAAAVLGAAARCRAETGSRARWVEIEWHVDDAGAVAKTVAHPVFIPPEGQPRPIDDATLRCIEGRVAAPPFTAAKGRPLARVFALIGFELPGPANEDPAQDVPFFPELDGHCRAQDECPPTKRCDQPPRVPCPRVRAAEKP